jgi:hypothetical protein
MVVTFFKEAVGTEFQPGRNKSLLAGWVLFLERVIK